MSAIDEIRAWTPMLIYRKILSEYDAETALVLTSVNPERHRERATALRFILGFMSGALSVCYDELSLREDWLPSLRAYLEPKEDEHAAP